MPADEHRNAAPDADGAPGESGDEQRDGGDGLPITRRQAIAGGGLLALLGIGGGAAAWATRSGPQPSAGPTRELTGTAARSLAEAHAPQLVFDEAERWFPTDPREYTSQRDGETVVDGFDAFDGYSRDLAAGNGLPSPTVCYHALTYEDAPLAVVQYWWYAAFDQFTTNFHWHDWEILHAFVDTRTGDPVLYVASAHSRSVPNNEYLDPAPDRRATVLAELGSHSSGLSVDDEPDRFARLPGLDGLADVTNGTLAAVLDLPAAYGLPRDEGLALPFLVPELDGAPIHEHERLPNVTREHLIPPALTVSSYGDLATPPAGLPKRRTGTVLSHDDAGDLAADVDYDLVPTADLDHITAFEGRQLSFEFAVPGFVEDAVASHITSTGVPWDQPRYDDPLRDVTDRKHRRALADRYGTPTPGDGSSTGGGALAPVADAGSTLVGRIRELAPNPDAPAGQGLALTGPSVEGVALLESEPIAVPTFRGVVAFQGVTDGDHRLTVNAPGLAPYAQPVPTGSAGVSTGSTDVVTAGVDGAVATPPNRDAVKLRVDGEGTAATLARTAIVDDFAGRIYDAPSEGRDAVYAHRSGAYTVDVTDESGALGSHRVDPGPTDPVATVQQPETGPAALAAYVDAVLQSTGQQVDERARRARTTPTATPTDGTAGDPTPTDGTANRTPTATPAEEQAADATPTPTATPGELTTVDDVVAEFRASSDAAARAGERVRAGERAAAQTDLERVARGLARLVDGLDRVRDRLPPAVANAVERRLELVSTRLARAREDVAA